jgi:hypothetical protein
MKVITRLLLSASIAMALASGVQAQDDERECVELKGAPPGMYVTTDEGSTFIIKDDQVVELGPGESGFADEDGVRCIKIPPAFLDWPCSTQAAQSRRFNSYPISDLETDNKMKEIVERYFAVPEVLEPFPNWIDGEYNAVFPFNDIIQFASPEYWYFTTEGQPALGPKRPRSLLVSLYVGTNQVVVDNHVIDALRKELGSDDIPVTFVFNDSNAVPISYFGANVSLEEANKAFSERKIKAAEVPMWWLGDYHLKTTIEEFEKYFDIPALEDISAAKQSALKADLEAYGFSRKSIIVTMFAQSGVMAVDQPERVRVAASMGITRISTTLAYIEEDVHLARCGPGTPAGSTGVTGATTPIGGPVVPPDAPPPPGAEVPASDS